MSKKSLIVVAAIVLALLTITSSALTAMKVFAGQSSQNSSPKVAQPAAGIPTPTHVKWEYRIVRFYDEQSLAGEATMLSSQGFEEFAFEVAVGSGDRTQFVLAMKRAKP